MGESEMLWARLLAYVTGTVNQELLLRNEYLAAENRILRGQIKDQLLLSEGEKATLAEIGHRLGRRALEEVAATAKPDTILGWYRKLVANKQLSNSPFAAGGGPFSVAVDPSGKFAYVANINSNNVSAYTIDSTTGALSQLSNSPFTAGSGPASVAVDPSGKFAYVANLFAGSVSAYTIDSTTGALSQLSNSPFAAGSNPASVAVDPSGKFAYVANAGGGVSAYTINSTTGALTSSAIRLSRRGRFPPRWR
jgi:streptogramin lyase